MGISNLTFSLAKVAIASALLVAGPCMAGGGGGGIVFDPTNFSQNIITATKTATQVTQQLESLRTQYQQYETQLVQLKGLADFSGLRDKIMSQQEFAELNDAIKAYKELTRSVGETKKIIEGRLDEARLLGLDWKSYLAAEERRIKGNVQAAVSRAEMERRTLDKVQQDYEFARSMDSKIPATEGIHQAMQLNNTALARLITQTADVSRTLATAFGSAKAEEMSQKANEEAMRREAAKTFLEKQGAVSATSVNDAIANFKSSAVPATGKKGQ